MVDTGTGVESLVDEKFQKFKQTRLQNTLYYILFKGLATKSETCLSATRSRKNVRPRPQFSRSAQVPGNETTKRTEQKERD
jgi:hypothetical protein